jgi:phage shock protein PspC (stress-responsive transcriptional regulator)
VEDRNRNDIALIAGVVILLMGVAALLQNLGIVPPFVLEALRVLWRAAGALAVIALGVLVIVVATRPGARPVIPDRTARIYRSTHDRMIEGVCGGIAEYLHVDSTVVRLIYVVLALGTGLWSGIVIYVALAVIIPTEPAGVHGA